MPLLACARREVLRFYQRHQMVEGLERGWPRGQHAGLTSSGSSTSSIASFRRFCSYAVGYAEATSIFGWCVRYTNEASVQSGKTSCVKLCALDFSRQVVQQRHSSDMPSKDDTSEQKEPVTYPCPGEQARGAVRWRFGAKKNGFRRMQCRFGRTQPRIRHDQNVSFIPIPMQVMHIAPYFDCSVRLPRRTTPLGDRLQRVGGTVSRFCTPNMFC
jgi:hypothetical protein